MPNLSQKSCMIVIQI